MMVEEVAVFGESHSLVGITTLPEAGTMNGAPAVILLNAGLIHRIGPKRVYVKIARALASMGFLVQRFDLSGIGDSEFRSDNLPHDKGVVNDTKEAMDYLCTTKGARKFVLVGICAGAMVSFTTACEDTRVVGAILIDPGDLGAGVFGVSVQDRARVDNYWRTVRSRPFTVKRLLRVLSGKSNYRYGLSVMVAQIRGILTKKRERYRISERMFPALRSLFRRDFQSLLIYTEKGFSLDFFHSTLADIIKDLKYGNRLQVRVIPGADHDFASLHAQEALLTAVGEWAVQIMDQELRPVLDQHGLVREADYELQNDP